MQWYRRWDSELPRPLKSILQYRQRCVEPDIISHGAKIRALLPDRRFVSLSGRFLLLGFDVDCFLGRPLFDRRLGVVEISAEAIASEIALLFAGVLKLTARSTVSKQSNAYRDRKV